MSTLTAAEPDADTPGAVDIAALERQLREKEQLVVALTDRLEQLAEQLDRLRRTGADRGSRRGGGGSFPLELVEDHRAVIEDLKQAVTRWEEMQAGATLGRLETQVTELRDLIVGFAQSSSAPVSSDQHSSGVEEKKAPTSSWWEKQKASLLGDAPPPEAEVETESVAPPDSEPRINLAEIELPQIPAAVEFDTLSLDAAKEAIRERDRVIAQLHEPLLLAQSAGLVPADVKTWDQLPEPLRERFSALEKHWETRFREHELALSLERARLSREEAALRQQKEQIGHDHAQRTRDKAADSADDSDAGSTTRNRWFRFLSVAGEEDDDE